MTEGKGTTPAEFCKAANQFGFTFNWGYVNRTATANFSSGRLPVRPRGLDRRLPTLGNGKYEWQGFLSQGEHPHDTGGPGGLLLNWNNRSAPGFMHGDDEPYGSVQRVELFDKLPAKPRRCADVVGIMNRAATEDVRSPVWPVDQQGAGDAARRRAPAPRRSKTILDDWVRRDAPRLDADDDGKFDDAGPDDHGRAVASRWPRPSCGRGSATWSTTLDDVRGLAASPACPTSTRTCARCWATGARASST